MDRRRVRLVRRLGRHRCRQRPPVRGRTGGADPDEGPSGHIAGPVHPGVYPRIGHRYGDRGDGQPGCARLHRDRCCAPISSAISADGACTASPAAGSPITCAHPKRATHRKGRPAGGSFVVREDALVVKLNEFLSEHVFGTYRRALLDDRIRDLGEEARRQREQHLTTLRRELGEIELKSKRALRSLELFDEPDQDLIRDINERRAQLRQQTAQLEEELAAAEEKVQQAPNPDLLDALPMGEVEVENLPEDVARRLFEALRLELRYDKTTNRLTCRAWLTGPTMPAAQKAADDAVVLPFHRRVQGSERSQTATDEELGSDGAPVPILVVPSAVRTQQYPVRTQTCMSAAWR